MIFDSVKNLHMYKGLYPNLDHAIDFIMTHDLNELSVGRKEINGDELFVNIVESDLKQATDSIFELHKRYLDLHIDIDGAEKVIYCDYDKQLVAQVYDEDGDFELLNGRFTSECRVDRNHFTICMLDEPHMPCIICDNGLRVKKAIFKIKI